MCGVGVFNLIPPERFCLRKECAYTDSVREGEPRLLGRRKSTKVVYCSREYGPVPAVSYSARCSRESCISFSLICVLSLMLDVVGCNDRYYHNYYIDQEKNMRVYYGSLPSVIHVNTHLFLELSVCDRFRTATAAAW